MKYIKFTYVDAVTGVSVASDPAANGPVFPEVAGLEYEWARESRYPVEVPEFFGTCPDGSNTNLDGVLLVISQAEFDSAHDEELAAQAAISRDRLKRQRQADVDAITITTAAGNAFDGDEASQTRMTRAIVALQATGTPAVTWVLADNSVIQASAAELVEALALAGAEQAALWVIE